MDEERKFPFEVNPTEPGEGQAPRARNRTVMLTPEMTGQVRARLAQETGAPLSSPPPIQNGGFSPNVTVQHSPKIAYEPQRSDGRAMITPPPAQPQYATHTSIPNSSPGLVWTKETPVIGFLVSFDSNENGEVFPLRVGRLIITSDASTSSGNHLLLNDESVSPMHAILRMSSNGEVQVLDQLSEHGTKVDKADGSVEEFSGEKGVLNHGDIVSFGNRSFHVCLIAIRG